MIVENTSSKPSVGFLDPHLVSEQCINDNATFVEEYMTTFLLDHREKDFILLPYNQG